MTPLELYTLLDALPYADRSIWESSRLTAFFVASKLCTKQLKITDIYKLPWDHDNDGEVTDLKEYMKQMKLLQNKLNKNGNDSKVQK